jgi:glycosyltransferase involved in cell wall biosynthesis
MNKLYNHPKVKTFVSLTHGEGFGRPLLEATMTGLPVIASAWSGQLDFLSDTDSMLLGGQLQKVPQSQVWKDIITQESEWFNVNEQQTYKAMNYCFENIGDVTLRAKKLMKKNRDKFTLNKMTDKLNKIMEKVHIPESPQQVGLNLPKLKKVNKTEAPKIKLPKLKKSTSKETL